MYSIHSAPGFKMVEHQLVFKMSLQVLTIWVLMIMLCLRNLKLLCNSVTFSKIPIFLVLSHLNSLDPAKSTGPDALPANAEKLKIYNDQLGNFLLMIISKITLK